MGRQKRTIDDRNNPIYVPLAKKYHCTMCGRDYDDYKDFMSVQSPLYKENNGRTTVCYECLGKLWEKYSKEMGSSVKGFERLCRQIDLYFEPSNYKKTMEMSRGYIRRLKKYAQLANLSKGRNKSYMDTLSENISNFDNQQSNAVELAIMDENDKKKISQYEIKYGKGFTLDEYKTMDIHFNKLIQQLKGDSVGDDIIITNAVANACTMLIFKDRAVMANNEEKVIKYTEAYNKALTGKDMTNYIKQKQSSFGENDCLGMWINDIEFGCPSEIYTDKGVYSDHRKHGRYMKRHYLRTLVNFFTGNYVPDEEYNIGVE